MNRAGAPGGRRARLLRTGAALLHLVGAYLVVRAAVEPFVIDLRDPATYARDWGGPHLAGVLAVHCLPGLVALVLILRYRVRRPRRADAPPVRPR